MGAMMDRARRWMQQRIPKAGWIALASSLALGLILVGHLKLQQLLDDYPIQQVEISGDVRYIRPDMLNPLVERYVKALNFFELSTEGLEETIKALPWVESVRVQKHWPDRVDIHLVELEPIAIWQEVYLLSSRGGLFRNPNTEVLDPLPHLSGPSGHLDEVLNTFQQAVLLLSGNGIRLNQIELTRFDDWRLQVTHEAGDVELWLNKAGVLTKLDQFVSLMHSITQMNGKIPARFDLRYPKGVAVKWLEAST